MALTDHIKDYYDCHASALGGMAVSMVSCGDRAQNLLFAILAGVGIFVVTTIIKIVFRFRERGL